MRLLGFFDETRIAIFVSHIQDTSSGILYVNQTLNEKFTKFASNFLEERRMAILKKTYDNLEITYTEPEFLSPDSQKYGKWSVAFRDKHLADQICRDVIECCRIPKSCYTNAECGMCCFFLSYDDLAAQDRIIRYMILNGLIEETVYGRLNNIPFRPVQDDRNNDEAIPYLDHFINLYTGEFII